MIAGSVQTSAVTVRDVAAGQIITPCPRDELAGSSHLIDQTLQPEYLVLLGIPLCAALAHKAVKDRSGGVRHAV